MARVEQVKGAVDVDDARIGRRRAPIAKLHDAPRGGHEARDQRMLRGRTLAQISFVSAFLTLQATSGKPGEQLPTCREV